MAESFPFSLFSLFDCAAYSMAELGGVCESRSVVEMRLRRKVSFSSVKDFIAIFSGWPGKEFGRVLD